MGATLDRSSNGDVTLLTKSAARVALEQATVRGAVTKLKFRKRPDQASFEPHMLGLLVAVLFVRLSALCLAPFPLAQRPGQNYATTRTDDCLPGYLATLAQTIVNAFADAVTLAELRDRKRRVVGPSRALGGFVSFVHGQPS
jgi:hypothetical protein